MRVSCVNKIYILIWNLSYQCGMFGGFLFQILCHVLIKIHIRVVMKCFETLDLSGVQIWYHYFQDIQQQSSNIELLILNQVHHHSVWSEWGCKFAAILSLLLVDKTFINWHLSHWFIWLFFFTEAFSNVSQGHSLTLKISANESQHWAPSLPSQWVWSAPNLSSFQSSLYIFSISSPPDLAKNVLETKSCYESDMYDAFDRAVTPGCEPCRKQWQVKERT